MIDRARVHAVEHDDHVHQQEEGRGRRVGSPAIARGTRIDIHRSQKTVHLGRREAGTTQAFARQHRLDRRSEDADRGRISCGASRIGRKPAARQATRRASATGIP